MTLPYTDDQISIDGIFVKIRNATYTVSSINSVAVEPTPAGFTLVGYVCAIAGSALGLLGPITAFAFSVPFIPWMIGSIASTSILWLVAVRTGRSTSSALMFGTASGQIVAVSSPDRAYVQKLQLHVQDAMKFAHDADRAKGSA